MFLGFHRGFYFLRYPAPPMVAVKGLSSMNFRFLPPHPPPAMGGDRLSRCAGTEKDSLIIRFIVGCGGANRESGLNAVVPRNGEATKGETVRG